MPAPLARGLIFSISFLIAAGIAVYENPQVREWLDDSRRKIALSLHNLGDDLQPRQTPSRSHTSEDVSTREDGSPEAFERRRRARQELYERARILEEKRREVPEPRRGNSFDDLVDDDGRLHEKSEAASTSATSKQQGDGLRKRHAEIAGAVAGAAVANPFGDEMGLSLSEDDADPQPVQVKAAIARDSVDARPPPLTIDTDASSTTTQSDRVVDLTPTTSAAPSSFPMTGPDTPTSASEADQNATEPASTNFRSVHEWAEASSASFYSAPESEASSLADDFTSRSSSQAASLIDVDERLSHADVMSEVGDISTPGSWTEVGSMISDEDA